MCAAVVLSSGGSSTVSVMDVAGASLIRGQTWLWGFKMRKANQFGRLERRRRRRRKQVEGTVSLLPAPVQGVTQANEEESMTCSLLAMTNSPVSGQ